MRKLILSLALLSIGVLLGTAHGQVPRDLWLQKTQPSAVEVSSTINAPVVAKAVEELKQNWAGTPGAHLSLVISQDPRLKKDGYLIEKDRIEAKNEAGLLYGAYALLRSQRTGVSLNGQVSNPSYALRMLNHWDNLDGSVERGYAGKSLFWRKENSFKVTRDDISRWTQYARANAAVGINATVLNNVNASPAILTAPYIDRVRAIADVLRPYGIKVYLSVNFASPEALAELTTADPLDKDVIAWWQAKVKALYAAVPDFGGLLVKASSEGQPGPQDFGRTHAEGANMLADALAPYGGVVMWRAFVYAAGDQDRAKQAYTEFMPLDGKFRDNVIIQVKNGPIDFQPREPFSPLFGAMKKTPVMAELQITQEYLGHSVYLCYLAPMWEECLKSDTYQEGEGSTVAKVTDGSLFSQKITAIAGVANAGLDSNWCGNFFAQANWYAYGRLSWNDTLSSSQIADEWIRLTFGQNKVRQGVKDWQAHFFSPLKQLMLESREAAVNFMTPLGLHHLMAASGHYGPGPWWAPKGVRADWTPPYFHKAAKDGIGFDRTTKGSDAVSQYHAPLSSILNDPATCPEQYLLWFHHLPWDYQLKSGRSLWDAICLHYETGVQQVAGFMQTWQKMAPYVDKAVFVHEAQKLKEQYENAVIWKDGCIQYFQQFSQMALPKGVSAPTHSLEDIMAMQFGTEIKS